MKRRKREVTLESAANLPSSTPLEAVGGGREGRGREPGLSDEFHFTGSTPFLPFPYGRFA